MSVRDGAAAELSRWCSAKGMCCGLCFGHADSLPVSPSPQHAAVPVPATRSKLATWEAGKPVPFSFLADTFDAIAETSKVHVVLLYNVSGAQRPWSAWQRWARWVAVERCAIPD